ARPPFSEIRLLSTQVNYADGSTVVAKKVVVNKSDFVASGREANIADPSGSFIEYFANGILDAALAIDNMDDSQRLLARNPIRRLDVVQQIARGVRADGNLRQYSAMREVIRTDSEAT